MRRKRISLLSWLILPFIGLWLAANFIIGIINRPPWEIDPDGSNWTIISGREEPQGGGGEIPEYKWEGEGLITFWFDDAFISQYRVGFSILDSYGFPAALAVPSDVPGMPNYMNWAQIKHVQYRGWEITSHSRTHNCEVQNISQNALEEEVSGSRRELKSRGFSVPIYVPPCGVTSNNTLELIKQNYSSLRTSNQGYNDIPVKDRYNLLIQEVRSRTSEQEVKSWIDEAKLNKKWLIIMFHRMNETNEEFTTTQARFRRIVNIVDESNLPVVLPSQVLNIQGR